MPIDSVIMSAAITAVFAVFLASLAWADSQTRRRND